MLFEMRAQQPANETIRREQSAVLDRTNENVADRVAALVRKVLDREEINKTVAPDDDLRASGLSSLGLVNLMLSVETEFDLKIPERDMTPSEFPLDHADRGTRGYAVAGAGRNRLTAAIFEFLPPRPSARASP